MGRESRIEVKLNKAVKAKGGYCFKFIAQRGVPDRIVLLPFGKIGFVEVKAPGEKPSKLQALILRKIREIGFKTFVLDDAGMIEDILNEILCT